MVLELVDERAAPLRGQRTQQPRHGADDGWGFVLPVGDVVSGMSGVGVDQEHHPAYRPLGGHGLDGLERRAGGVLASTPPSTTKRDRSRSRSVVTPAGDEAAHVGSQPLLVGQAVTSCVGSW